MVSNASDRSRRINRKTLPLSVALLTSATKATNAVSILNLVLKLDWNGCRKSISSKNIWICRPPHTQAPCPRTGHLKLVKSCSDHLGLVMFSLEATSPLPSSVEMDPYLPTGKLSPLLQPRPTLADRNSEEGSSTSVVGLISPKSV